MKVCTRCKVEKDLSEFGLRDKGARVHTICKPCLSAYIKGYYKDNKDKVLEKCKEWVENNRDKVNAKNTRWREANRDTQRRLTKAWHDERPEYLKEYREKNREVLSDKKREYRASNKDAIAETKRKWRQKNPDRERNRVIAWFKNNPEKHRRILSKRRAGKRNASVVWANEFFIEQAYELAMIRTKLHGIPFEVDHVVPLTGKINGVQVVCGLHVEYNLQVIPKEENRRKLNLFWPDMP